MAVFCFLTACRTGRLQGAHGGTFTSGGEETPSPWEVSKKEKKPKKGLPGLSNPVLRKQGLGLSVWQGLRIDFTVIQKNWCLSIDVTRIISASLL